MAVEMFIALIFLLLINLHSIRNSIIYEHLLASNEECVGSYRDSCRKDGWFVVRFVSCKTILICTAWCF